MTPLLAGAQSPDPNAVALVVSLRRGANAAAVAVIGAGLLVLLGWVLGTERLTRLATAEAPIKPSSATAFVLSGAALWLLAHGDMRPRLRIAAALVVAAIGALTLSDYLFGFDLVVGRMPANAGLAFLLVGGSLMLGRVSLGRFWAADVLGFAAGSIGLVALVGHAVAAPTYHRVGGLAEMSFPAAICFVLLGGGILLSVPKRGASRLLVSDGPGGALARWLLPAALLTPLLVGVLRWQGQVAGLWEGQSGVLLLLVSCMSAMAVVIWFYARSLDRTDAERRAAEAASSRLAALVDFSDDAIVGSDVDATVLTWNRGAERLYGYTADEIVGHAGSMLLSPEARDQVPELLERLRGGEAVEDFQTVCLRKDGRRVEVELTLSPIRDAHGEVTGISSIARDISDRRRLDRERVQALSELERSNAELEQYASVASHDLGEPLRVVSGFVQLLQRRYEGKLDADADRFIAATVNGVDRMQAIIDALLDYSRVGRAEVGREQMDCEAVAQGAIEALQAQIEEARGEVRVNELPVVRGDAVLLGQVFQNLISNAIKFTNGADPVVEISAECGQGEWVFSVADNGVGIDPRNVVRVFEMFQRAHGSELPGIGIGLAMCKRIFEKHGGRIWAESRATGGTVMRFSLPDTPAPDRAQPAAVASAPTTASPSGCAPALGNSA